MRTVDDIFTFEERTAFPPFVDRIRRTWSEPFDGFISAAQSQCELVVTRQAGQARVVIRGPQTTHTVSAIPKDAEFLGARFQLGAFIPALPPFDMIDTVIAFTSVDRESFRFDGEIWEAPTFDTIDIFLARLVRRGLLRLDPLVESVMQGGRPHVTQRTAQRRIRRATGLTPVTLRQIERAAQAASLLRGGLSAYDVVDRLGYADHPHLTRSLKRFAGQTPSALKPA